MSCVASRKTGPWVFSGASANEFYHEMMTTIRLEGEAASPRGLPTTELLHVVSRIADPRRRVLSQYGRGLNPFFNLAESLWILQGRSDADWICFFNSQLRKFLDPPLTHFHGAYGERLRRWPQISRTRGGVGFRAESSPYRDQLLDCFHLLRDASDSRQAVMVLWNPLADGYGRATLGRPCNVAVAFKVRAGRLWMSVFNRSNDVVLGLTSTNIVQFSTLQESLASWLEVDVGPYTHYSDSLHLYDSQEVCAGAPFDVYAYVLPTPMARRTPGDFDADLSSLYEALSSRIALVGRSEMCEVTSEFRSGGLWPACPYWNSVGWALLGYVYHKQKNGAAAVRCVGRMATADWQVECLRFLADRYGEDRAFVGQVAGVLRDLPARGGLEGRQALWQYVFQTHGVVPLP